LASGSNFKSGGDFTFASINLDNIERRRAATRSASIDPAGDPPRWALSPRLLVDGVDVEQHDGELEDVRPRSFICGRRGSSRSKLMTQPDLRAQIRNLMASGSLPSRPWLMRRAGRGSTASGEYEEMCSICTEGNPTVRYYWPDGHAVKCHEACDLVWQYKRRKHEEESS
jgi:hypothetical protein